jgi:hypothetical protein
MQVEKESYSSQSTQSSESRESRLADSARKPDKMYRYFLLILAFSLIAGYLLEYLGWMIAAKADPAYSFPGPASWSVWKGALLNTTGAISIGIVFSIFALLSRSFRQEWKNRIHKPLWAGALFFFIAVGLLALIGLYA